MSTSNLSLNLSSQEPGHAGESVNNLRIDLTDFEPIVQILSIATKTNTAVPTGTVVFAPHDRGPSDRDRFPEFYLDGETIVTKQFRRDESRLLFVFARTPGRLAFHDKVYLNGISQTHSDVAAVHLEYDFRVENPKKYLDRNADPDFEQRRQKIKEQLRFDIHSQVESFWDENNEVIWTAERIANVADLIHSQLDDKLKGSGLRLSKAMIARRQFPRNLRELALEFKSAERELVNLQHHKRSALYARLGLGMSDWVRLQSDSQKYDAIGVGLLFAAKRCRNNIQPFLDWLEERDEPAPFARKYFEDLYSKVGEAHAQGEKISGCLNHTSVELSEQVLLSALRNPALGIGELDEGEVEKP